MAKTLHMHANAADTQTPGIATVTSESLGITASPNYFVPPMRADLGGYDGHGAMAGAKAPFNGPPPVWIPAHAILYNLGGTAQGLVFYAGHYQLGNEAAPISTATIQYGGTLSPSALSGGHSGTGSSAPPVGGWGACAASVGGLVGGLFAIYQGPLGVAEIGALSSALGFAANVDWFANNIAACETTIQGALGSDISNPQTSLNDIGSIGNGFDPGGFSSGNITFTDPTANESFSGTSTDGFANGDALGGGGSGWYTPADYWNGGGGAKFQPDVASVHGHFAHV